MNNFSFLRNEEIIYETFWLERFFYVLCTIYNFFKYTTIKNKKTSKL